MSVSLQDLYEKVALSHERATAGSFYVVLPIQGYQGYYIGKDHDERACLLISTRKADQKLSPIRLKNLDVQFELPCRYEKESGITKEDRLTVIRCRSDQAEIIQYFLSICEVILLALGNRPTQREVASVVNRLAEIFKKAQQPPTRTINGLFGELYLISRSANPSIAVTAWRSDISSRFDFVLGHVRLDAKVTENRVRTHTFSYEQSCPPENTLAIAASMFAERSSSGLTIQKLINNIEKRISSNADLVFKLHEVTTASLGTSFSEAMKVAYDTIVTESSLQFFDLTKIPAIRGPLPAGVSNVHFRSDLSTTSSFSIQDLTALNPAFREILPQIP